MNVSLSGPDELVIVVVFTAFAVTYGLYYLVSHSKRIDELILSKYGPATGSLRFVLTQRLIMVVGAGAIPALLVVVISPPLSAYGLNGELSIRSGAVAVAAALFSAAVSILARKTPEKLEHYPQIRTPTWTPGIVILNTVSWACYLFAYELTFRGFMLFSLLPFGLWTSVAVNTALYVAVHVPKGGSETIGAIVFGPVLCLLTVWSGSIWIAYLAHLGLALGNSYSCLAAHPEMRVGTRRRM